MVFDQEEIEDSVISHFNRTFKASYNEEHTPLDSSAQVNEAMEQLDEMMGSDRKKYENLICSPYTFSKLDDILKELPNGKASGCDAIPNELLKNAGIRFKSYLLIFLNQIMDKGKISGELNKGKCLLIYKVSENQYQIYMGYAFRVETQQVRSIIGQLLFPLTFSD